MRKNKLIKGFLLTIITGLFVSVFAMDYSMITIDQVREHYFNTTIGNALLDMAQEEVNTTEGPSYIRPTYSSVVYEGNKTIDFILNGEVFMTFNYDDESIYYENRSTIDAKSFDIFGELFHTMGALNLLESVIDLSGYPTKMVYDFENITMDSAFYSTYGLYYEDEEYNESWEDETGNGSVSGSFLREFRVSLNPLKIEKLVQKYGVDESGLFGSDNTVDSINIINAVAPVDGQKPDVSKITTDTEGVVVKKAFWIKESDGKELTENDTFVAGQRYLLQVEVEAASGYEFIPGLDENNFTININYLKAEFVDDRYIAYCEATATEYLTEAKQTAAEAKTITLGWNTNATADGFLVQVKSGKKWKTVATIKNGSATSKKIKKLKAGKKYTYRVVAYKNVKKVVKKKTKTVKENISISNNVVAYTTPNKPTAKIKGSTFDSVKVGYKKKVGGTAYYVLARSTEKKGTYTDVTSFTGTYTDTDVKTGTTYYYKVKACNANNFCSGYSGVVSKKPSLGKLSIKVKSPESGKVLITPKTVSGEDGYVIEYSKKSKGGFIEVANLDVYTKEYLQETTEEKKLDGKKTYYFRARAYKVVDEKPVYGPWSKIQKVKVKK